MNKAIIYRWSLIIITLLSVTYLVLSTNYNTFPYFLSYIGTFLAPILLTMDIIEHNGYTI